MLKKYFYERRKQKRIEERRKQLAEQGMALDKPQKDLKLLAKGQGMYVGGWFNPETKSVEALMDNDVTHVLCVAPTRAGKGVGVVMPTMLTWTGSTVVHDTKPELWPMTAGWRKAMGHTVLKFDPAAGDGSSVKYNPLEEVRWGTPQEVADVQNIAEMLMNPTGKGGEGEHAHWVNSAIDLTTGTIFHIWYSTSVPLQEKNLGGLLRFLSVMTLGESEEDDPALAAFRAMSETRHVAADANYYWTTTVLGERVVTHPQVKEMCGRMIAKADRERGSVISSALANLKLYADPVVAENTQYSEFRLSSLMNGEKPVDLYLVVKDPDIDRMKPLTRLLVTQIISYIMSEMRPYKHRCLFMLDEFASLGKLDKIPIALTKIAGYGVKFTIILQTLESLKSTYGPEKAGEVTANCHTRVMFSPNDLQTAKEISDVCGKRKITSVETSVSGKRLGILMDNASMSQREEFIDLITPAEALQMHKDEIIVMKQGQKPIRGRKFYFYQHPEFLKRAANDRGEGKYPVPAQSDRLLERNLEEEAAARPVEAEPEEEMMSVADFIARARAKAMGESAEAVNVDILDEIPIIEEDDLTAMQEELSRNTEADAGDMPVFEEEELQAPEAAMPAADPPMPEFADDFGLGVAPVKPAKKAEAPPAAGALGEWNEFL
ncbi:type IV secretory system conjugative DNA transfer family protein [Ramlibacter alkalitolerans]|uniref:Type IV secretory system conjugative DNA transfer family protein n=1 Tax=Ramlibacter alkalitolerans TaxID=2039631 RepID=A0ABS1JUF9_9BURK|nr:type IV secretory system conjugative DNA transfer family protein [Ramlibacter alkalitolerans]MBL0427791.1 type IV secretory system conjugative DNA transfer family protein [Ramlibacter alkalitolerans]